MYFHRGYMDSVETNEHSMLYVEKVKIRPQKALERKFIRLANNARFIYNQLLAASLAWHQENNKRPGLKHVREALETRSPLLRTG